MQWTVNAYVLMFGATIITAAALGDLFDRRWMYALGLVVFTVASAACALAPNIGVLIACRAVEGVGAGIIMPLGPLTTEVAPRIAPLLLLLSRAAETDTAVAQLRADLDAARLARMTRVAETLAGKTQLRPGLSVQEAAEIMWAYSSPELYGLLVISRAWSPDRYGEFVGESLVDALLGRDSGDGTAHDDRI